jgi:hypothetical protein
MDWRLSSESWDIAFELEEDVLTLELLVAEVASQSQANFSAIRSFLMELTPIFMFSTVQWKSLQEAAHIWSLTFGALTPRVLNWKKGS